MIGCLVIAFALCQPGYYPPPQPVYYAPPQPVYYAPVQPAVYYPVQQPAYYPPPFAVSLNFGGGGRGGYYHRHR